MICDDNIMRFWLDIIQAQNIIQYYSHSSAREWKRDTENTVDDSVIL